MCSVYIFHCKHSNSRSPFGINICILGRQPSEEKGKRVRELYECEKTLFVISKNGTSYDHISIYIFFVATKIKSVIAVNSST